MSGPTFDGSCQITSPCLEQKTGLANGTGHSWPLGFMGTGQVLLTRESGAAHTGQ